MCFDHESQPPALPAERVLAPLAGGAGAEVLTLRSEDGTEFSAAFADTPSPSPVGVVIIPDVAGCTASTRSWPSVRRGRPRGRRVDPFGQTAGVGERDAEFDYMPHVKQTTIAGVQADIAACSAARASAPGSGTSSWSASAPGAAGVHASTRDDIGLDAVVGSTGASWPPQKVRWPASSRPRSTRRRT